MKQFFYLLPLICVLLVVGPIEAKKKKYPNGDFYEGEWKKGAPHGIGIMKYANGSVYEGNWELGKRNGQGTMKYANGDVYIGNWLLEDRNGHGVMKYRNGYTYDGNWILDERSGQGKMKYLDGSIYNGMWENNEINGVGRWDYPHDKYEEGLWKEGILMSGQADVNLYHDGKYHLKEYFTGIVRNGDYYEGKIYGYYKNAYYEATLKNGKVHDGIYRKETELGLVNATYSNGIQINAEIKAKDGWLFKGQIVNDLPDKGLITFEKDNEIIDIKDNWGYLIYNNDTINKQQLSLNIKKDARTFGRWINICHEMITKKAEQKRLAKEAEEKRLAKEAEEKQRAIHMARHEENVRQQRIKDNKIWAQQLPYYIWETRDIRSAYENNPARFRRFTQNKYVIIGGTIADIDESRNFEYSQLWQDWVEYKYYTIRLSGGVYFESRDAEFVSKLNTGQELLFVGSYTDEQSFNRPLFDLRMYAGSTQGIIKLMLDNGISLSKLVKR